MERNIEKINRDIKSAGQSFLAFHLEDLISKIHKLNYRDEKNALISLYHANQIGFFDKNIEGTRTRVNAAIRIIKANKVIYALEVISNSKITSKEAIRNALKLLNKLNKGGLKLTNSIKFN